MATLNRHDYPLRGGNLRAETGQIGRDLLDMILSSGEQRMLNGEEGLAKQKAMELLVKYGTALGAERFVDTNNVHVLAGFFPYPDLVKQVVPSLDVDEVASKFLLDTDERIVLDRVKAFTTNHIFAVNKQYWKIIQHRSPILADLAERMETYCRRVGINNLATCTPYQVGNIPSKGEHCAWTESSAIPFANAVLGARTNIEGSHSSFASAITGKTPLWGMHLEQNRLGDLIVEVDIDLDTVLEWGLIGYYIGGAAGLHIPVFVNVKRTPNLSMLMALNAAGASSGSIIMYHIVDVTPEAATLQMATGNREIVRSIRYGKKEREQAYLKLNHSKSSKVDIVVLGCPHYSIEQITTVARLLEGKKIHENTSLYITTCKQIKALADRNGYTEMITRAGGLLLEDTCGLEFAHHQSSVIATDSPKQAHYYPGVCGVEDVWYGATEECIDAAITSKWTGELK